MDSIKVSKIDVDQLINMFIDIWENGGDYIDLEITKSGEGIDYIKIEVREDVKEKVMKKKTKNKKISRFSEENLDDLTL